MSAASHSRAADTDAAYPPLSDYGLIGDCHSAALVSRVGAIDWCCLPRFDSDSCFGRLLDWRVGGYFQIAPTRQCAVKRDYLSNSLILVTTFTAGANQVRLIDFFAMRRGGRSEPRRELIRIIEGVQGSMNVDVMVSPRLDFGEVKPWIRRLSPDAHFAVGSNVGLLVTGDVPLEIVREHDLHARVRVRKGTRLYVGLRFVAPEEKPTVPRKARLRADLERHFKETRLWWKDWTAKMVHPERGGASVMRSAIILKALTYAPTGAIIAAPTTSLPERIGGTRNWDYRYSWIRDSVFTVETLAGLGFAAEADGFRRFIERSAAGAAEQLQVIYAVDGKRRLPEVTIGHLTGWRRSRPVRIGNAAEHQYQGDMFGLVLELAWRWSRRGNSPHPHYWKSLVHFVEAAISKWSLPDSGIWEIRAKPQHFVHSKVMCWAAVNRGIELARKYRLRAPLPRWRQAREEIRAAIETRGYDSRRGIFVQRFGSREVDAALLLLPSVEFLAYDDERMVRTTATIKRELACDGLILRYKSADGLSGQEGVFLPCSFWLAECLARQGQIEAARTQFEQASGCANDLGLFAEEYSTRLKQPLGNFPQGLTHLAFVSAALALHTAQSRVARRSR